MFADYRALAEFRYHIRRFLRFSEEAARAAGLEPQQHQLLLALKGMPEAAEPSIGHIAERLQLRHHTAVELVNRLAKRRMIRRAPSPGDRRKVLVELTAFGERTLQSLTVQHQAELRAEGPALLRALRAVAGRKPR